MPAAHIEFFGGPLDGTRIISSTTKLPDVWTVDGADRRYKIRVVLGNIPVRVPHGRYAMDYVGVVEASTNDKNP